MQLLAVDADVLLASTFQLEKEKHLKCYYACSGPRHAPVAKPRYVSATVRLPLAQETDCLSLHDFASLPDDDNNSHSSEWWQTEGVGGLGCGKRNRRRDGDLLSRSICCHSWQSKQRFGLEAENRR